MSRSDRMVDGLLHAAKTLSGVGGIEKDSGEYSGGSVSYYRVSVKHPTATDLEPYVAECNDIIEALGMNYAEGNAFKAIWRACAARHIGKAKRGYDDGLYDAQKVEFFGGRMVQIATRGREGAK